MWHDIIKNKTKEKPLTGIKNEWGPFQWNSNEFLFLLKNLFIHDQPKQTFIAIL